MAPQWIALISAFAYSSVAIAARLGLNYSTPLIATWIALGVRTFALWTAVFIRGGIPDVEPFAVLLFVGLGVMQTATSYLTFTGVSKIGAARSQPLRSSYPLWSAAIAIIVLHEEAGAAVLLGTFLVVAGVVLISWQTESKNPDYNSWWHALFPLGASLLAGIAFPVRRYALGISNEPLFFAALLALVSLLCLLISSPLRKKQQATLDHKKGIGWLVIAGGFEALAALLSLVAVSVGKVVVVAPIVATSPLWTLGMSALFLRGLETISVRTILGTLSVVAGTVAVILGD